MKKSFIILLFFLCFLKFIWAQEMCRIEEMNLLPVRFYVGDNVELRLIVSVPPGRKLELPVQVPDLKWIEINENVRISNIGENNYELRILFTSFIPGSHLLSNIIIGDFLIPNVTIDTRSILDDKEVNSLAPNESQVELPGTWPILSIMIFIILFMPYILLIAGKQLLRIFKRIRLNRKKELPGNKLRKGLKKIKHGIKKISPLSFYIKITELLRVYLNDMLSLPVLTATTRELNRLLSDNLDKKRYAERIITIFRRADLIKFAGAKGRKGELSSTLDIVFNLVDFIEEDNYGI